MDNDRFSIVGALAFMALVGVMIAGLVDAFAPESCIPGGAMVVDKNSVLEKQGWGSGTAFYVTVRYPPGDYDVIETNAPTFFVLAKGDAVIVQRCASLVFRTVTKRVQAGAVHAR